eukprot:350371-Chlamydomonas_euryale.AAC.5
MDNTYRQLQRTKTQRDAHGPRTTHTWVLTTFTASAPSEGGDDKMGAGMMWAGYGQGWRGRGKGGEWCGRSRDGVDGVGMVWTE